MKLSKIEFYFNLYKKTPGDLEEHMDTLRQYASDSKTIVELGTRKVVSTWAFLAAHPEKMICVDIVHPQEYDAGYALNDAIVSCAEEGIDFKFIQEDDLKIELEKMDLLFIDTLHNKEQLSKELELHGNKAKKYIIFHDTEIPEMAETINDFLSKNEEWKLLENRHNNNGLIVIGRNG
jgi:hypothetical protein